MDLIDGPAPTISDRLWHAAYRVAFRLLLAWWWCRRPTTEGVYVAVWSEGRLLIIRNSYKRPWTMPCGMLGRNEEPRDCAVRELAEETGLDLAREDLDLNEHPRLRHENKLDHVWIFEARLAQRPTVRPDGREVIAAAWALPDELAGRELSVPLAHFLSRTSVDEVAAATASGEKAMGMPRPSDHNAT